MARSRFVKPNLALFKGLREAGKLKQASLHARRSIEFYDHLVQTWEQLHAAVEIELATADDDSDDDDDQNPLPI